MEFALFLLLALGITFILFYTAAWGTYAEPFRDLRIFYKEYRDKQLLMKKEKAANDIISLINIHGSDNARFINKNNLEFHIRKVNHHYNLKVLNLEHEVSTLKEQVAKLTKKRK